MRDDQHDERDALISDCAQMAIGAMMDRLSRHYADLGLTRPDAVRALNGADMALISAAISLVAAKLFFAGEMAGACRSDDMVDVMSEEARRFCEHFREEQIAAAVPARLT